MRILVCGSKGQLGYDCTNLLISKYDVAALDLDEMDITNAGDVERIVHNYKPDIILNCAAYTRVDACEVEKELAWETNVEGPRNLSLSIKKYGGKLIHISTDYVFNGKRTPPEPYLENDEPSPLSYYGLTKLEGELAVRQITKSHVIIRTAWVYGINGQNFLKTILRRALRNPEKEIKVVNDQYGSPTWSFRLAQQIERIIEADGCGIYHATSEGYCTWYELARYFMKRMNVEHNIVPCSTDEYPTPAVRPQNSILDNRKLKEQGINLMPHWEEEIDQFVAIFKEALINEMRETEK